MFDANLVAMTSTIFLRLSLYPQTQTNVLMEATAVTMTAQTQTDRIPAIVARASTWKAIS